jgi:hypothetical protein
MTAPYQPVPQAAAAQFGQIPPPPGAKGPNIWYSPVKTTDYKKISEMGTATIVIRLLPGFNQSGIYEAIFEKNTANSKYPNSKRYLAPILVMNDSLHPQMNGFVGVMEMSKTLYSRIKSKTTPQGYFDFNNGYNFNINVTLKQSKEGDQWFPDYSSSGFDKMPSPCNANYVCKLMNEGKFSDFAPFVTRLNTPKQAAPATAPATVSGGQAPWAVPAAPQMAPSTAPVQPQQTNPPWLATQPQNMTQAAPAAPTAPAVPGGEEEFNKIFG